ncbi:unnamed protein product [Peniophora sp. CBMAI 1063]|nr:unnamed protein product [Peniophora sp. CBMAI 1063]
MPSFRTIHLAVLLAAAFILSATAAPAPAPYLDTSDPPLRTTSIAKKRAFTEEDMLRIARSLSAPVQRYGEYGYAPADMATREALQQIMDVPQAVGGPMGC